MEQSKELKAIVDAIDKWVEKHKGNVSFFGDFIAFEGKDFKVVDQEMAYLISAKISLLTIIDLLYDGALKAKEIIADFQPNLSKEEYLDLLDSLAYHTRWEYKS